MNAVVNEIEIQMRLLSKGICYTLSVFPLILRAFEIKLALAGVSGNDGDVGGCVGEVW